MSEYGFERILGVSQLYIKRDRNRNIILIAAKVTDDILFAGKISALHHFTAVISKRYSVRKSIIDEEMQFNGCTISQDTLGNIHMDMSDFLNKIKPVEVENNRRTQANDKATGPEIEKCRSLAGALLWLGAAVMPQASCVASFMQQNINRICVRDIIDANARLKELRQLPCRIKYIAPKRHPIINICTFSDASYNISESQSYGQTGIVTGLSFGGNWGSDLIFHPVDWTSSKQRRVSHSSYGAEILACSDADDRGYYVKQVVHNILQDDSPNHELNVDSKGLYETITTLHEGREYRLIQTVQRIRDSFESEELDVIRWVQGFANIADALTKHNPTSFKLIGRVFSCGILCLPTHESYSLDSSDWK